MLIPLEAASRLNMMILLENAAEKPAEYDYIAGEERKQAGEKEIREY